MADIPPKAILLFSGGLDSILAANLLKEQGIEVTALHCTTPFTGDSSPRFRERMRRVFGINNLIIKDLSPEFLPLLYDPPRGLGSQMNPCIDCKILFLKAAREAMDKTGASFIATGEVVGQRPFSQRREAMELIEREAGVKGILLRPLSARLLPPTIPEEEGIVDRERLLEIQGRGRKPQLELARRYGLKEIPSPAGGCLLTDPGYCRRLKAIMPILSTPPSPKEMELLNLLKVGRHFGLEGNSILVVARNRAEAEWLVKLERGTKLSAAGVNGVLLNGGEGIEKPILTKAAEILARYVRGVEGRCTVEYEDGMERGGRLDVVPMPPEEVEGFLIC